MSKRENHWYLAELATRTLGSGFRPRAWALVAGLALAVPMWFAIQSGALDALLRRAAQSPLPQVSPLSGAILGVALFSVLLALGFGIGSWRRSRIRTAYLQALAAPTAEPLVAVTARTARMTRRVPDGDAFAAHSRAIAYALYGRGPDAFRALGEVSWGARAPLVRAVGLSAEAIVEALCRRDAPRALELARRAQGMAVVSARVPGAAQTARAHATCVALAEALSGAPPPPSLAALEASAAQPAYPALQVIATFALAIAAERAGDPERAERHRAFLRRTAPHCAPLHAGAGAFAGPAEPRRGDAPASAAPPSAPPSASPEAPPGASARRFRRALLLRLGGLAGMWAALLLLFLALYRLFGAR